MSSSSDNDSDISQSEKDGYKEKSYNKLKAGKYKIKNPNATLRCPFCEGKKKQAFQFGELLQHASGIGTGSSKRSIKIKAKHLALAKFLEEDLSTELSPKPELEIANEQTNLEERFVWPWKGIVANIFRNPKHDPEDFDSEHWLRKFEVYKPKEAHVLHSAEDPRGYVVLEFGTDWTGFRQVMKLDTDFLTSNHGKKDWDSRKNSPGSEFYGWCARAEDYYFEGLLGTYLREKAEVKSTSDITQDACKERSQTVAKLVGKINDANKSIGEVETRYTQKSISLEKMMEEMDLLHKARVEDTKRMQQLAREHARRTVEETEKLRYEIYTKSVELDCWCQQLSEQENLTINERRKFEEEKKKKTESLILASEEQAKANIDVVELLEKHKIEKMDLTETLLKLEKEQDDEHKLEMEIAELEGQLNVLKCMNGVMGGDAEKGKKQEIKELEKKLEEMIEEVAYEDSMNQILKMKKQDIERELEDARQEFIAELPKCLKTFKVIGVKKFGEISDKPFQKLCKNRYKGNNKASLERAKLLRSKWQDEILDSTWHPFKITKVEGNEEQEVIDEDDQKLVGLKKEMGEEVYEAVVMALKELNEYSGNADNRRRVIIPELWNFKTQRKATLKEVIAHIIKQIT
ncbi:Zinc finger-XS domain [Sesbania bispinosa]|nr:Zinc finger-XS domain [Sesbania bispinosa]